MPKYSQQTIQQVRKFNGDLKTMQYLFTDVMNTYVNTNRIEYKQRIQQYFTKQTTKLGMVINSKQRGDTPLG
jgi:hypothetical protein